METIQVVLDRKLLQAADRVVRRTKRNRSALIRDALREHLADWRSAPWRSATARATPNGGGRATSPRFGRRRRRGRRNSAGRRPSLPVRAAE